MQDQPLTCECGKPFSPGHAMRCRCRAAVHTECHDVAVDCDWRVYVERSAQASTREPADAHLQGDAVLDPALVNGKRVDFHVLDTSGSVGCDVTLANPTCSSYLGKSGSAWFREAEQAKTRKHVLNGATMVPVVLSTFGKLGPAAAGYLQNFATVACSTGVVDRGVWSRISRQYLSSALVSDRAIVLRHY
jgi:hypothetical protein